MVKWLEVLSLGAQVIGSYPCNRNTLPKWQYMGTFYKSVKEIKAAKRATWALSFIPA